MPTTHNRDVELFYETFGDPAAPTLLLVNGLGSQCINFKTEFCEKFAAEGFRVVRFDNRDVGLSSHLVDGPEYTLADMADDAFAVLDAVGASKAHIAGWSMGGMIVQTMALAHPERVLSLTSVMSSPGGVALARAIPRRWRCSARPLEKTRDDAVARHIAGLQHLGLPGVPRGRPFDRRRRGGVRPLLRSRRAAPVRWRRHALGRPQRGAWPSLEVPTLVIHGDADRLVPIEAGELTHKAIPGSRFEVVAGMGHDYPPQLWDTIVNLIATHAKASTTAG